MMWKFQCSITLRWWHGHYRLLSARLIVEIRGKNPEVNDLKNLNFSSEGPICKIEAKGFWLLKKLVPVKKKQYF